MWLATAGKRISLAVYIAWLGLKSAYEYRAAFWLQVGGMIINNSAVIVVIALFYAQFGEVNGWGVRETLATFGTSAIAFGLLQLMFGNIIGNKLGERIVEGELDSYLLFPQSALFHLSIRRIDISGLGDVISGLAYLTLSGYLTSLQNILLLPVGVLAAMSAFYGTLLCAQSFTFWLAGLREFGTIYTSVTTMPSNWPPGAFEGIAKVFFFGIFPALFVVFLPAEIITDFKWSALTAVVGFAVAVNLLGRFIFKRGLKRYESGNLMTTNL